MDFVFSQASIWAGAVVLLPVLTVAGISLYGFFSARRGRAATWAPFPRASLSDLDSTRDEEVRKVSDLPDGWWASENLFDVEKQAIFARV